MKLVRPELLFADSPQTIALRVPDDAVGPGQLAAPERTIGAGEIEHDQAIAAAPPEFRGQVENAIHASFATSLNDLLFASGILALVGGVLAFALIRSKDFVAPQGPGQPARPQTQETEAPQAR